MSKLGNFSIGILAGLLAAGLLLVLFPSGIVVLYMAGCLMAYSLGYVLGFVAISTATGWGLAKWGGRDCAYGAFYGAAASTLATIAFYVYIIANYHD